MNNINLELNNNVLDEFDLTSVDSYLSPNLKVKNGYNFYAKSGKEHYRFLGYLSSLFSEITILDIGTHMGGSALALASNKNNKVISFDIVDKRETKIDLPNLEFYIGDINDPELGHDIIKSAEIIFYDTVHDGTSETTFHNLLLDLDWSGIVVWDDIKFNWKGKPRQCMIDFWNNIENTKYDITKYAHWTGTGIVQYGNVNINLKG